MSFLESVIMKNLNENFFDISPLSMISYDFKILFLYSIIIKDNKIHENSKNNMQWKMQLPLSIT